MERQHGREALTQAKEHIAPKPPPDPGQIPDSLDRRPKNKREQPG